MRRDQMEEAQRTIRQHPPRGQAYLTQVLDNGERCFCALGQLAVHAGVPVETLQALDERMEGAPYPFMYEDVYGELVEPLREKYGIEPSDYEEITGSNDGTPSCYRADSVCAQIEVLWEEKNQPAEDPADGDGE